MDKDKLTRILTAVSAPVLIALLCIYEYQGGTGMECEFYRHTGLYCPGCGSGRAVSALFHGRFAEALSYNILLPDLRIVFPGLGLKPVAISQKAIGAATAVIIVFWVLRNIPAFSFLAP